MFRDKVNQLSLWSIRSDFVDAVVWPALQARCSLSDLEVFSKGIQNVLNGERPEQLDFSIARPSCLEGIGLSHFFTDEGKKYHSFGLIEQYPEAGLRGLLLGNQPLWIDYINQESERCDFMKFCEPTSNTMKIQNC